MSRPATRRPIVQPVLDRLLDFEPRASEDGSTTYTESVRQLKTALQRDLEWLLNTRRITLEPPESAEQLRRSLFHYGLPDFADRNMAVSADQAHVLRQIESAISTFEPRLTAVRVSMRPPEGSERTVHFWIEAILLIDPIPERVTFDTVLQLANGEYQVRGERGA